MSNETIIPAELGRYITLSSTDIEPFPKFSPVMGWRLNESDGHLDPISELSLKDYQDIITMDLTTPYDRSFVLYLIDVAKKKDDTQSKYQAERLQAYLEHFGNLYRK